MNTQKFTSIKKILIVALLSICTFQSFAQNSNGIFFQAVARDNFSNPAKDRNIYVQSTIIQNTTTGTKVLIETHKSSTDAMGVFNITIGNGQRTGGTATSITAIDWSKGPFYLNLKIAITPFSASDNWDYTKELLDIGTTSFGAVPFAFYSASSAKVDDKLNANDTTKMLAVYAKAMSVKTLETSLATKLTAADTLTMLAPYAKAAYTIDSNFFRTQLATKFNIADTINYSKKKYTDSAISKKLNIADSTVYVTPAQLAAKTFDQTPITNAIATKLNIADSTKYITPTQLASYNFSGGGGTTTDTSNLSNRINLKANTTDLTSGLALKLDASQKGVASGLASLDANSKVPSSQIPVVSFQSANVVASETAMLGLSSALVGSIAIRTDNNRNYVLSGSNPAIIGNWVELAVPTSVTTINGIPGSYVTLTTNEIGEGTTNKYFTDARVRAAISASGPLNYNSATGTLTMTAATTSSNGYLSASDFTTFNNKQNTLVAGTDYATPSGNITGNAANVTGIVSIVNGGTGTSTATGALTTLGAEARINKSTATDLGNTNPSDLLYPSQKAVKTYVDLQNANSGVADLSITNAKLVNSTTTLGSTTMTLGGTVTSVTGLSSVTATNFVGTLSGSATTSLNIAGGVSGSIPYQTAAGTTFMIPTGSANQFLTSTGSGTYTWTSNASVTSNYVPYTGATSSVNLGAYDLKVNGLTIGLGAGSFTNTVVGYNALASNTSGYYNNAFGYLALLNNTTGFSNTAIGAGGLMNNTIGYSNLAIGAGSLMNNIDGNSNLAIGIQSLNSNNSGFSNTGIGSGSLFTNTTGNWNVGLGTNSLYYNQTGSYNFAIGSSSLYKNIDGNNNVAIGNKALFENLHSNNNVAIGAEALLNSLGEGNIAIGTSSLAQNYSGAHNTAIGYYSDVTADNIQNSTAIGFSALVNASNTIQLGNPDITNVKTSGTLTLGTVTYPKIHGTNGQVLSTTGTGALVWANSAVPSDASSSAKGLVQLAGDLGGTSTAPTVTTVGGVSSSTIGTINTTVTAATSSNTVSTIVKRDASGNFSAGTITANLTGNVTGSLTGNATTATTASSVSGTVTIANGGTNATTASAALSNLGAASIGANLNDQTGTTYTLQSSDNGKVVTLSNASAITVTVPAGLVAGFNCMIVQKGVGVVTLSPANTVTVTNRSGGTKTGGQNAIVTIISIVSNYFITGGDMQ